ncbi:type IV toxin-antitoxin system AbiEi family antitoxin domain-containing protein [Bdellovibrionales bacterium]|nr:type IV toxin-antitoxin system AbiEi family antitoxin domain-containing protein [Bdellovibrionales bacterium]
MTQQKVKQKKLFLNWGDNEVHTQKWFHSHQISNQLTHKYLTGGLIQKLGGGAYIKANEKLDWKAGIFAAQSELNLPVHVAGKSSFELQGVGHYLSLGKVPTVLIMARKKIRIPVWLKQNDWGVDFQFKTSHLFDGDIGLETFKKSKFHLTLSSRERAIMEMIDVLDLSESFEPLEQYFMGLTNIRSDLTQQLLENCNSIKVKRVFLYMSTELELPVIKKINLDKIDQGKGKRLIVKNGVLNKVFNITVPKVENVSDGP